MRFLGGAFHRIRLLAVLLVSLAGLAACSSWGAQPWQRGDLARPEMSDQGDAVTAGIDEHVYFSKEASSGGRTFGGGGCGCN